MKKFNIWRILFFLLIGFYFYKVTTKEPEWEIDPTWKYNRAIKIHDDLYQHEFIDSLGRTNIIFRTTPEIHIMVKKK